MLILLTQKLSSPGVVDEIASPIFTSSAGRSPGSATVEDHSSIVEDPSSSTQEDSSIGVDTTGEAFSLNSFRRNEQRVTDLPDVVMEVESLSELLGVLASVSMSFPAISSGWSFEVCSEIGVENLHSSSEAIWCSWRSF